MLFIFYAATAALAAALIFCASFWLPATFGQVDADQILFQARVPAKGADPALVRSFVARCLLPALAVAAAAAIAAAVAWQRHHPSGLPAIILALPLVPAGAAAAFFLRRFGFIAYSRAATAENSFIAGHYRLPSPGELVFPSRRRNLLYIFLESMESSFAGQAEGGALPGNVIPELTALAARGVNFSHTGGLGGAAAVRQTGWTVAGMCAQHAALPLKVPFGEKVHGAGSPFLPGAVALGDVLAAAGYNQTLLLGSDAAYSGRSNFYSQHGNFRLFDSRAAAAAGLIPPNYRVRWGFEDEKLYAYAKEELLRLAAAKEPFHLTMLTVDTHTPGGYRCPLCPDLWPHRYLNALACADRQIADFIRWVLARDFAADTTIVVAGDHLSMEPSLVKLIDKNYQRTVYNVFLGAVPAASNHKNRRFTVFDLLPTTLAAMGVKIAGERFGLGVNLFCGAPTLLETYGLETLNRGLSGRSDYYRQKLFRA
ncbi:MAG: sulfatase-like hydrolase/transferase [Gracilibacteraceae bacterium]|nr:sulfatase-like hydrolase/transferase [Gracilibacteraceae bacterium]